MKKRLASVIPEFFDARSTDSQLLQHVMGRGIVRAVLGSVEDLDAVDEVVVVALGIDVRGDTELALRTLQGLVDANDWASRDTSGETTHGT